MAELENYAELKFTNAVLIDIFSRYADNSEMAEFVAADGSIDMKFKMVNGVMETPKCCEQVLSLMYALFECNPQSTVGRIYHAHQVDILRETVYRLAMVLDSFSDVKLTIHATTADKNDPGKKVSTHTEFTLKKSKTTETKVIE
ncbi:MULTISPECIES: hypothetical protein [Ruminococcus]|uniref:Uncharacterized protein n=1 Tax=Ruminococcus flavefaciens TaxID=1265 RepID=A0A1M7MBQ5_RUMFL|nr:MULTISPECIES: hypothetical protein [Ruminococcus]MCR4795127.1 hypothetical protein [Ruminococcus sp.]SHM88233.1 hypothetical protein SAMN04487860_1211 [Ruminococcus flavefaciens]